MKRAAAYPKRGLEVEIRRMSEAIFIGRGDAHRELSEVGGMIWRLSNGKRTIDQIAEKIAEAYDVDVATAENDALAFLEELSDDGFIGWADPPGAEPTLA